MKSQADVFINRELSWIEFNKRVLLTGMEKEYKILDKVKFCSIFSNNLDEFFMVRVASLKAQVEAEITKKSIDGLTPCLLYTSPSPRDWMVSRMPSSA